MKIQILDRFEPKGEWHEIYANGELLYEGEVNISFLFQKFLRWLNGQEDIEVEIRNFVVDYTGDESGDYNPPLHVITAETYWEDWDKANEQKTGI